MSKYRVSIACINVKNGEVIKRQLDNLLGNFIEVDKLVMNSGSTFGVEGEGFVRLNIAASRATVEEAMRRLEKTIKKC